MEIKEDIQPHESAAKKAKAMGYDFAMMVVRDRWSRKPAESKLIFYDGWLYKIVSDSDWIAVNSNVMSLYKEYVREEIEKEILYG